MKHVSKCNNISCIKTRKIKESAISGKIIYKHTEWTIFRCE